MFSDRATSRSERGVRIRRCSPTRSTWRFLPSSPTVFDEPNVSIQIHLEAEFSRAAMPLCDVHGAAIFVKRPQVSDP